MSGYLKKTTLLRGAYFYKLYTIKRTLCGVETMAGAKSYAKSTETGGVNDAYCNRIAWCFRAH